MLNVKQKNTIITVILTAAFVELIRTAWISDDAAITLRTVLNFINGYGPTFNIDERVQAYTHPLWFLLISGLSALTKNVFTSTFFLSIGISLAVLWMLVSRIASNFWAGVLGVCVLIFSKAYVDYSTSGLENPLSHLLILLTILLGLKASERSSFAEITEFFLTCSLLYLSRPDLPILAFPISLLIIFKNRQTPGLLAKAMAIGILPVITWELFSVYYYGFLLPNTAYAKLGTGIPIGDLIIQGGKYLLDSAGRDPLTLAFIFTGIIIGLRSGFFAKALAGGIILYLAYVVGIGGDFMSGRFLTTPLLVAAVLVARADISKQQLQIISVVVGALAMTGINATLLSNASYSNTNIEVNGITDERGYWFQKYGLLNASKAIFSLPDWKPQDRIVQVKCGGLGFTGLKGGPGLHLIDYCGLADPLLARIPAKYDANWRIGHYLRQLPENYERSVRENKNLLTDEATKKLYNSIRVITQNPLNDSVRLKEIIHHNFSRFTYDFSKYRFDAIAQDSEIPAIKIEALENRSIDSGPWDAPGNIKFTKSIDVVMPSRKNIVGFDVSLDANGRYLVEYFISGSFHYQTEVASLQTIQMGGMVRYIHHVDIPSPLVDRIRITALSGDGMHSLGYFRVTAQP